VASLGAVIALLGVLMSPGMAPAQETVESSLVRGRVLVEIDTDASGPISADPSRPYIMGTVYGVPGGSRVELACEGRCQMAPESFPISSSGLIFLGVRPKRGIFVGDRIRSTLTDPQGRRMTTEFRVGRRNRLPVVARSCFDPAGNEVPCVVECVRGARVAPEDPCRGAGRRVRVPKTRFDWYARWHGRKTRFTRLRVSGLPAGVQLFLLCKPPGARGCPFFARVGPDPFDGVVDFRWIRGLERARFGAGVRLELHFLKASQTAAVIRWVFRNDRKPRVRRLCQAPHRFEPHPC
jgi:hypothetical protein